MTVRYNRSNATMVETAADYFDQRDEEVMQALVTVGALVALVDGEVRAIERDELVGYVHRQGFASSISQRDIAEALDNRVRQLQERDSTHVILEALRPLAGLSLSSVVVRTAERVAAVDRYLHPNELQAIKLIRLIMTTLPTRKLSV